MADRDGSTCFALMWLEEIVQSRGFGEVRCALARLYGGDPYAAARKFGLNAPAGSMQEVDAQTAVSVLEALLWKDMAYSIEAMPRQRAHALAERFVALFQSESARFFTNGSRHAYHAGTPFPTPPFGYWPFTDATFDGGVVAVTDALAGCVWIEDED